jgi:hypothetical protein
MRIKMWGFTDLTNGKLTLITLSNADDLRQHAGHRSSTRRLR